MATVTCWNCGEASSNPYMCQNCRTNLMEPPPASARGKAESDPSDSVGGGTSQPRRTVLDRAAESARLAFPWGEVVIHDRLNIGRDPDFSPLAVQLERTHQGVSRQHAELWQDGAELFVRDLGSLNGTHLNGTRLEAHEPMQMRDGDQLGFGRGLIVTVRVQ